MNTEDFISTNEKIKSVYISYEPCGQTDGRDTPFSVITFRLTFLAQSFRMNSNLRALGLMWFECGGISTDHFVVRRSQICEIMGIYTFRNFV